MIIAISLLLLITLALLAIGQKKHWGYAPVGILGLGFIVPVFMLLTGVL